MAFNIALDDVKRFLGYTLSDTTRDFNLQLLIDAAAQALKRILNREMEAAYYRDTLGSMVQRVYVREFPIINVQEIRIGNSVIPESDYKVFKREGYIYFKNVQSNVPRILTAGSGGFLEIDYSGGVLELPADLKVAVFNAIQAGDSLNRQLGSSNGIVKKITVYDVGATEYATPSDAVAGSLQSALTETLVSNYGGSLGGWFLHESEFIRDLEHYEVGAVTLPADDEAVYLASLTATDVNTLSVSMWFRTDADQNLDLEDITSSAIWQAGGAEGVNHSYLRFSNDGTDPTLELSAAIGAATGLAGAANVASLKLFDDAYHHAIMCYRVLGGELSLMALRLDGEPVEIELETLEDRPADSTPITINGMSLALGGYGNDPGQKMDVAEFWVSTENITDASGQVPESMLLRFRDEHGYPVSLGDDGSLPTGNQPLVYLHVEKDGEVADFITNLGSGADFTATAGVAMAYISPTD